MIAFASPTIFHERVPMSMRPSRRYGLPRAREVDRRGGRVYRSGQPKEPMMKVPNPPAVHGDLPWVTMGK
jgi:hypothetical protein